MTKSERKAIYEIIGSDVEALADDVERMMERERFTWKGAWIADIYEKLILVANLVEGLGEDEEVFYETLNHRQYVSSEIATYYR